MAFSSMVLRHFLCEAEQLRIARPEWLRDIVDESRLDGDGVWISDREMFEIVLRTQRASTRPGLGLRLGGRGSFAALGAAGIYMGIAPSFRQALCALVQFWRIARDQGEVCVRDTARILTIEFEPLDAPPLVRECMTEWTLSSLASLLARYAGPDARPSRVILDFPAPRHVPAYVEMFNCELSFDQPRLGLVVDKSLADRVWALSQPTLAEQVWQLAQNERAHWEGLSGFVDRVRERLRAVSLAKPPTMSLFARGLGMSERSLRRRLADQGVDYRTLVAERHQQVASEVLRRHDVSVKELAHRLGYSNSSAFYRAYKRWTGVSPTSVRRGASRRPELRRSTG